MVRKGKDSVAKVVIRISFSVSKPVVIVVVLPFLTVITTLSSTTTMITGL